LLHRLKNYQAVHYDKKAEMKFSQENNSNFFANALKFQANDRLEEFRQYTQEIESKFDADKAELARRYSNSVNALSAEEVNEVNDYFADDYFTIEEIYVGLFRKSTLVSIYSFLENAMNRLCKYLARKNSYSVALNDLKGEGIVRARNYLEKTAGADFNLLNGEWSKLKLLNKVRNCIVHCEGDVSALDSRSIAEMINATPGLSLRSERLITVERIYIDACITTVEEFLEKLYNQLL
jgi:hypothetical protein